MLTRNDLWGSSDSVLIKRAETQLLCNQTATLYEYSGSADGSADFVSRYFINLGYSIEVNEGGGLVHTQVS